MRSVLLAFLAENRVRGRSHAVDDVLQTLALDRWLRNDEVLRHFMNGWFFMSAIATTHVNIVATDSIAELVGFIQC